ncbi:voltage-gated chloride channel protein [Natranaerobius trueperi]|uniref:Voltage-gated chloride channel protein n=1 Tax=Natranaerobius trueperi TaxID=759412 RepID=A0A226C329_9FIRM|nr:voltage-gated chloride channel protein [Natranaerobius trueperi]
MKKSYKSFVIILINWGFLGSIIGVFVGSTSALLLNVNDLLTEVRFENPQLILLLPIGGLIIGFIYTKLGQGSGKGNNLVYEHVHYGQGGLPLRMGPIVFISTFITHLLGGSTGREGAAIQMGGSIAESVIRFFNIDFIDRKIFLMTGISAAFGSAFGTPLAGTIMGMEVVSQGKFKYEGLIPCFIGSFTGHFVTITLGVQHEHHVIKSVPPIDTITLDKVIVLSIVLALASILYSQMRHGIEKYSRKYLKNLMLRGFIGGTLIVALVYIIGTRDYLGRGLPFLDEAFVGQISPLAFLAKILFTAITMGSGFRGGEVIPLFFIGATLGNTLSPIIGLPTSFLAALGLISVFCGGTNVPITAFIFSVESFQGQGATYFFMTCIISYILAGQHSVWPSQKLYEPKSRLLNVPPGKTIKDIEEDKKTKE